ncbi:MAG: hypothetical protein PHC61_13970 [Chitinivibrionales bacterium]|nr:hypothetical protein [Chitinivibrionales bacterium]
MHQIWTETAAQKEIVDFELLSQAQQRTLLDCLNAHFPPELVARQRECKAAALRNALELRRVLESAQQYFPPTVSHRDFNTSLPPANCALVFTAGGEGERLRLGLMEQGVPAERLTDFTKATYPLTDFYGGLGTLAVNLCAAAAHIKRNSLNLPVIITVGPAGSLTADVIPRLLKKFGNFGIKNIAVVEQDERLHFTDDNKIAVRLVNGGLCPVTQPDETGGPLMKLKRARPGAAESALERLAKLGVQKIMVLQATAIYHPELINCMAAAAGRSDCVGVGIMRTVFDEGDPFGSYVLVDNSGKKELRILELLDRNPATMQLKDPAGACYAPSNTGFYALDRLLLQNNALPDYATPPKEVLPNLPRAPKIGYAATDIFPLAGRPLVLTIPQEWFGVLKTAPDLSTLSALAVGFGLEKVCREIIG